MYKFKKVKLRFLSDTFYSCVKLPARFTKFAEIKTKY